MDAVEFLKKLKRMCDENRDINEGSCYGCEIFVKKAEKAISCSSFIKEYPEEAIAIVEKWSAEHPIETRQSKLLKAFPNAEIENGIAVACPKSLDKNVECMPLNCNECTRKYWLEEVE